MISRRKGLVLPAQSITLLVVPSNSPARWQSGGKSPDGALNFRLDGSVGQRYRIEQSSTLTNWTAMFTNTLASNSMSFSVTPTNLPRAFFRSVVIP